MKPIYWLAAGAVIVIAGATTASAFSSQQKSDRNTPPNWSYEVRNGQRVPRVPRKVNPDGSWTEEVRQGNCTVTRTGRDGEVRETRKCD